VQRFAAKKWVDVVMGDGRIIEEGEPETIYSNPQQDHTREFLDRY